MSTYLNETDRWFHERTGIRLPDPSFDTEQHRVYDRLAYEIAFGQSPPDEWALTFTIDLTGKNLTRIVGGFCVALAADANPEGAQLFLRDIRYE